MAEIFHQDKSLQAVPLLQLEQGLINRLPLIYSSPQLLGVLYWSSAFIEEFLTLGAVNLGGGKVSFIPEVNYRNKRLKKKKSFPLSHSLYVVLFVRSLQSCSFNS